MYTNDFDTMSVTQRIKTFDAKHGGEAESEFDGYWVIYSDGAKRDANPLGPLSEPPENPRELAIAKVYFAELRLRRAVIEFDNTKKRFMDQAGLHHEHRRNVRTLKKLQKVVQQRQGELAEAEENLRFATTGRTPEQEAEYQAKEQARRSRVESAKQELADIKC